MKYNKITAVCIAGVMAVSLTGCMDSVKDLSDEKSDMVAEYSAGLLLRHSDSYSKRLVTKADQTGNNSQDTGTCCQPDTGSTGSFGIFSSVGKPDGRKQPTCFRQCS